MSSLVDIDSKGYGKIYKSVMRSRELPLLAKTIYAYFCAYAGCGYQAFPKREKILHDLQINKDTYTKHLNLLVSKRYIAKERTAAGNLYTILQSIPADNAAISPEATNSDLLVFENAAAHGFGTIPKLVMLDERLSPQAKAIYAYFASFAGAGTTAFPRRSIIMRELRIGSLGTYYQHFEQLVQCGYLSTEQRKNNGRFDICIYRLHDAVCVPMSEKSEHGGLEGAEGAPMSEKPEYGGKELKTSPAMSEIPLSEKQISEKLEHQKSGQANNNNKIITNSSLEKEQEYNHQADAVENSEDPSHPAFSVQDVMEIIDYAQLQADVSGWGQLLGNTLHRFESPTDEQRYQKTMQRILLELVNQITKRLNQAKEPNRMLEKLRGPAFDSMFEGFLSHWAEIRNPAAYVAASLKSLY